MEVRSNRNIGYKRANTIGMTKTGLNDSKSTQDDGNSSGNQNGYNHNGDPSNHSPVEFLGKYNATTNPSASRNLMNDLRNHERSDQFG